MSDSIVPKASLRPNDVLLGRGNGTINYCGSVAFRALVETRRAEYAAAVTETSATNRGGKTAKARIADEVMECVLTGTGYSTGVEPGLPGRFLKQASAAVLADAGLGGPQSDAYWIESTRSEALTKVKMALRQIDRKEDRKAARQKATFRSDEPQRSKGRKPTAEAGAAKRPKADHVTSAEPASTPASAAASPPLVVSGNGASSLPPVLFSPSVGASALLATMNSAPSTAALQAMAQQQQQLLQQQLVASALGRGAAAMPPNSHSATAVPGYPAAALQTNAPLASFRRDIADSSIVGNNNNPNLISFVSGAFGAMNGMITCHNQGMSFTSVLAGNPPFQQNSTTAEGILSGEVIRSDLVSFGSLLFKELTGSPPEVDRTATELYEQLLNDAFPSLICTLVASLLDAKEGSMDDPPYSTAEEVMKDLKFLMDNSCFVIDPDAGGDPKSIWDASHNNILWGRSEQMAQLMDAYKRVVRDGGPLGTVFISGQSGTGKTAMVEQLYEPLCEKNGGLISIKFEEMRQKLPLSLIFEGLERYCIGLLQGDTVRLALTRKSLSETLGAQFSPLYQLIPSLRGVVSTSTYSSSRESDDAEGVEGELALNRIIVLVRMFVAAVARPEHPLIFVADDLQWSDESSLHLISTILADTSNCLLFVGLCRDDEVGPEHALTADVEKWKSFHVPMVDIRIGNLDADLVNEMLSHRLKLLPHSTRTLAEIVTQKTEANPLFINQLLRSLFDAQQITFSEKERRWKWDDAAIHRRGIADNVVEFICCKLRELTIESQQLLMNAACLGSQSSEESLLRLLWGQDDIDFDLHLALLITEGLLCKVNETPARFSFPHDRIQEAVYAKLIPAGELTKKHLSIARRLRSSGLCSDQRVYILVDQYVRARDLVVDHGERIKVAKLCLDAGVKASLAAAFSLSSWCLSQGVLFLCDSDWETEYELCLRCHSKCAVSQNVIGEHANALKSLEPVFQYGKTLLDTMEASLTFIEVQSTQGNFKEGLKSGLELLAELGQTFPPNPSQSDIVEEFGRVERLRKSTDMESLLEKEVEDPLITSAIKALTVLIKVSFRQNHTYFALFGLRGAELSLKSGACLESPMLFAVMGMLQVRMQRFDEARELTSFALELIKRSKDTVNLPRVFVTIYATIYPLLESMHLSAKQLKHGYEVGIKMGDADWGIYAGYCFVTTAIRGGDDLQALLIEARQLQSHAMAFNHELTGPVMHLVQVISNLCDENIVDATVIVPEIPTRKIEGDAPPQGMPDFVHIGQIYMYRLFLSYLFGRYSEAHDVVVARESFVNKIPHRHGIVADETFYTGLTAVAVAREKGDDTLLVQARQCLEKMEGFSKQCQHNFEHKQRLLEAEIAVYDCKYDEAASLYDDAIRIAGEHGFIHEQGLAHEKAGSFYYGLNRSKSLQHFECSKKCFLRWGSPRKVRDLEERYAPRTDSGAHQEKFKI